MGLVLCTVHKSCYRLFWINHEFPINIHGRLSVKFLSVTEMEFSSKSNVTKLKLLDSLPQEANFCTAQISKWENPITWAMSRVLLNTLWHLNPYIVVVCKQLNLVTDTLFCVRKSNCLRVFLRYDIKNMNKEAYLL